MDCKSCKEFRTKKEPEVIPYAVHEMEMVRAEKRERRFLYALVASGVMLLASNLIWLCIWLH